MQDAQDLYSIPMLLQYDPKVISVEDVRQGGFLSGRTQPIAVVQRVDKERGQAIVSATRMPNTPGVSGSGTVFGLVVRGVAAGNFHALHPAGERARFAAAAGATRHQRSHREGAVVA